MEEGDILKARSELEKLLDPQMIQFIKQAIPDNSLAEPLLQLTSLKNKCNKLKTDLDNREDKEVLEQQLNAIERILNFETNKLGETISPGTILYYIKTACEHAENGNFINGGNTSGENKNDGR